MCLFFSRFELKTWEETQSAQNSLQQYVREWRIWIKEILTGALLGLAVYLILSCFIMFKNQNMYRQIRSLTSWMFIQYSTILSVLVDQEEKYKIYDASFLICAICQKYCLPMYWHILLLVFWICNTYLLFQWCNLYYLILEIVHILNIYMVEHITCKCFFTDVTSFHTQLQQMLEINKWMERVTLSFSAPLTVCQAVETISWEW